MTNIRTIYNREVRTVKRALMLAVLTAAVLAIAAVPAFAEGYNDGGWNYTTGSDLPGYGDNAGIYVRSVTTTAQVQSFAGPHGGYTTTTNKCQDCHSTHYALGSYMLLRANDRENACTFCHAGGGGSSINIQMDNAYDADGVIASADNHLGTGHTLGYSGSAPADIEPAFTDTAGLACFSCHTPHGNSARVLEAFGSPSRPAGDGMINTMYGADFMTTQILRLQEMFKVKFPMGTGGAHMVIPEDLTKMGPPVWTSAVATHIANAPDPPSILSQMGAWQTAGFPKAPGMPAIQGWWMSLDDGVQSTPLPVGADGYYAVTPTEMGALMALFPPTLTDLMANWYIYWGSDLAVGNINTKFWNMGNFQQLAGGAYGPTALPEVEVWVKPLFPKGRFLLLKNPDTGDDFSAINPMTGKPFGDTFTVGKDVNGEWLEANATSGKKQAIDWDWPLGPAASWGPFFSTDSNERFPLAFPWAPRGVAMQNEFCTSCHDGTAGLSTQPARVYVPEVGGYMTAFSHDSNSRGCARQQYLNPGDDSNFGPHCANCHTGASGCYTCHDPDGENWIHFGKGAYASATNGVYADPNDLQYEGRTSYLGVPSVRANAVTNVGVQCIDGGFSYPHRTLGVNMLKDELWGVDFDGTAIAPGEVRMTTASVETSFGAGYFGDSWKYANIAGQAAHNLDSVCIDCHGDATFWNGDDPDYYADFVSGNPLGTETWRVTGWELLLKGLP